MHSLPRTLSEIIKPPPLRPSPISLPFCHGAFPSIDLSEFGLPLSKRVTTL